jgi:hypothetical protein
MAMDVRKPYSMFCTCSARKAQPIDLASYNLDFVIDSYAYSYRPTGRYQQLDTRRRQFDP